LHRKGDAIPRDWFAVYENVESAVFGCDVYEQSFPDKRFIYRANDADENEPMMVVMGVEKTKCVFHFERMVYLNGRTSLRAA